jgi:hypothetical protein
MPSKINRLTGMSEIQRKQANNVKKASKVLGENVPISVSRFFGGKHRKSHRKTSRHNKRRTTRKNRRN